MEEVAVKPVAEAVEFLKKFCPQTPSAAVVLGSGVKVLEDLEESRSVSYEEVFGLSPGVVGHSGTISVGRVGGKYVAVLRGRFHLYEGHSWDVVTLPAQVMVNWGVKELLLTNAAGGINQNFKVGDLMLITGYRDHLNPEFKKTGVLSQLKTEPVACKNALTDRLLEQSQKLNQSDAAFRAMQQGVYIGLLGPNYETLAEIDLLKFLKCDAVGMSTVPEILACKGSSTTAAAVSVITNVWSPDELIGGHEEVLHAAKEASERLDKLFRAAI